MRCGVPLPSPFGGEELPELGYGVRGNGIGAHWTLDIGGGVRRNGDRPNDREVGEGRDRSIAESPSAASLQLRRGHRLRVENAREDAARVCHQRRPIDTDLRSDPDALEGQGAPHHPCRVRRHPLDHGAHACPRFELHCRSPSRRLATRELRRLRLTGHARVDASIRISTHQRAHEIEGESVLLVSSGRRFIGGRSQDRDDQLDEFPIEILPSEGPRGPSAGIPGAPRTVLVAP